MSLQYRDLAKIIFGLTLSPDLAPLFGFSSIISFPLFTSTLSRALMHLK